MALQKDMEVKSEYLEILIEYTLSNGDVDWLFWIELSSILPPKLESDKNLNIMGPVLCT